MSGFAVWNMSNSYDLLEKSDGSWEAPSGKRKSWRKKNPNGKGYIYSKKGPGQGGGKAKKEGPAKEVETSDVDENAILRPGGGPGIFGMTKAQVMEKINAASDKGRSEPNLNKTGSKQAWIDCWEELFPHGTEAEMARVPDGNVDPRDAVITFERLKDPHKTTFVRYIATNKKGQKKAQTCNTVQNLVRNDAEHWEHIKGMMGDTKPQGVLDALKGKGDRPSGTMGEIYDLANNLRETWKNTNLSTRERDSAMINSMIMITGKRRGLITNFKISGNRGITTLLAKDVSVDGDTVKLDFIGKGNAQNLSTIKDPELANYIRERLKNKDGESRLFDATDTSIDNSLKKQGSPTTKPKDFRTLVCTARAVQEFSVAPEPMVKIGSGKRAQRIGVREALDSGKINKEKALSVISRQILSVVKVLQKEFNHSNAGVTRDNYIHPEVFNDYLKRHDIADLVPKQLDPYQKHSRRGADDTKKSLGVLEKGWSSNIEDKLKPFIGTPYYKKAITCLAKCKRAEAELLKCQLEEDDEDLGAFARWNSLELNPGSESQKESKLAKCYKEKRRSHAEWAALEAEFLEWASKNSQAVSKSLRMHLFVLDMIKSGEWEAPSGKRKSWRKKKASGKGYIYRKNPPAGYDAKPKEEEKEEAVAAPQKQPEPAPAPAKETSTPAPAASSKASEEDKKNAAEMTQALQKEKSSIKKKLLQGAGLATRVLGAAAALPGAIASEATSQKFETEGDVAEYAVTMQTKMGRSLGKVAGNIYGAIQGGGFAGAAAASMGLAAAGPTAASIAVTVAGAYVGWKVGGFLGKLAGAVTGGVTATAGVGAMMASDNMLSAAESMKSLRKAFEGADPELANHPELLKERIIDMMFEFTGDDVAIMKEFVDADGNLDEDGLREHFEEELLAHMGEHDDESVKSFSQRGFGVLVKGDPGTEDADGNMVEDPNRNDEEDTFHWPPWILEYGMTAEQRKRFKAGEELKYKDVEKGFAVQVGPLK